MDPVHETGKPTSEESGGSLGWALQTEFNSQEAIRKTMEIQARRSMRSLSCSSRSSLTSLSSFGDDDAAEGLSPSLLYGESQTMPQPQVEGSGGEGLREGPTVLAKRKRKRNPGKEAERRSIRQKRNPRPRLRGERLAGSKAKQGAARAVQTHTKVEDMHKSRKMAPDHRGSTLEAVKSRKGMRVIEWDGV